MVVVGFTGTRRGMTDHQKNKVDQILTGFTYIREAHHGDCVGADADFHDICHKLGIKIFIHPSNIPELRAFKHTKLEYISKPKPPLDHNRDIVDSSNFMIATPGEYVEQRRSGTWATIRYARKQGRERARSPVMGNSKIL